MAKAYLSTYLSVCSVQIGSFRLNMSWADFELKRNTHFTTHRDRRAEHILKSQNINNNKNILMVFLHPFIHFARQNVNKRN